MEDDFREFVAARFAALLRTAYLLTGDWATAEDLVQTALTKIYCAANIPAVMRSTKCLSTAEKLLLNSPFAILAPSRSDPHGVHLIVVVVRFAHQLETIPGQVLLRGVVERHGLNRLHRLVENHWSSL